MNTNIVSVNIMVEFMKKMLYNNFKLIKRLLKGGARLKMGKPKYKEFYLK